MRFGNYQVRFILTPKQVAHEGGFSLPTFYCGLKSDPKFPRLVTLGHNARGEGVYKNGWIESLNNFYENGGG